VTGQADFILKVVVQETAELEAFITKKLLPIRGIAHTNTSIVLAELKSTTALPLGKD
jgi:DNA-binding Lrp family transcriptional regulator